MAVTEEDFRNMQGLIRFGYRRLTEASFLLVRIRDAAAARSWLQAAPVTDAVQRAAAPDTALHLAFTSQGLQRLGLPATVLEQFSLEFLGGMSDDAGRSRLLGDIAANGPQHWDWGRSGQVPDMLVLLYARPGHLHAWSQQVQNTIWEQAFTVMHCLPTSDQEDHEPFGFRDSLSQPSIDWNEAKRVEDEQLTYSNLVSTGEFVLGYGNEYGRYTDRPLLADSPASVTLPPAADTPTMRDLGRNGCYLVLRTLEQDVAGFWNFARHTAGAKAETFAEAMVGRTREGTPLVPLCQTAIPGVDEQDATLNQFTFDDDAGGTRCPFGSHIRRANPRNADLPTPPVHGLEKALRFVGLGKGDLHSDAKASARFHRILRRGREYGPAPTAQNISDPPSDDGPRGIHFIGLVANIARQFEFLQSAWMMSSKFDAMTDESDPLLGNREPVAGAITDTFSQPQENGLRKRTIGIPQFVTVKGGAYFFLPSLAFLRYLAALPFSKPDAQHGSVPFRTSHVQGASPLP